MPRTQAAQKTSKAVAKAPAARAAAPRTKLAPVRSTRQYVESEEQTIGQDSARAMRSRGTARGSLDPRRVEPVGAVTKDHLEALAFNEEMITVLVHDSTNPLDEPMPEVWNDGIVQRFQRGREMTVKRKFVEVLARAKKTTHTNEKFKDGNGDDAYRYPGHTALKYPFTVIEDKNPKGKAWLKGILSEG